MILKSLQGHVFKQDNFYTPLGLLLTCAFAPAAVGFNIPAILCSTKKKFIHSHYFLFTNHSPVATIILIFVHGWYHPHTGQCFSLYWANCYYFCRWKILTLSNSLSKSEVWLSNSSLVFSQTKYIRSTSSHTLRCVGINNFKPRQYLALILLASIVNNVPFLCLLFFPPWIKAFWWLQGFLVNHASSGTSKRKARIKNSLALEFEAPETC